MNEHNFLTIDEMASTLKVPKSWLYSRTRETGSGSIPRVKVGKYIRFRLDEVLNWIDHKQESN
jgi:excisionase family DNA binding protein